MHVSSSLELSSSEQSLVVGKKETVRTDAQLLRKNRERVDIEANISTIEDAAGQPAEFLIVARDVTERKQMEYQLDSSLADLQRSNAELEQFCVTSRRTTCKNRCE